MKRVLTEENLKELSRNKNVSRCSVKSICFTEKFKRSAIRRYEKEKITAIEIFEDAGFDLNIIGVTRPNKLMNQWRSAVKNKNKNNINTIEKEEVKTLRSSKQVKMLKATIKYLEAENCFLEQLRAKKKR